MYRARKWPWNYARVARAFFSRAHFIWSYQTHQARWPSGSPNKAAWNASVQWVSWKTITKINPKLRTIYIDLPRANHMKMTRELITGCVRIFFSARILFAPIRRIKPGWPSGPPKKSAWNASVQWLSWSGCSLFFFFSFLCCRKVGCC